MECFKGQGAGITANSRPIIIIPSYYRNLNTGGKYNANNCKSNENCETVNNKKENEGNILASVFTSLLLLIITLIYALYNNEIISIIIFIIGVILIYLLFNKDDIYINSNEIF
jgi:hypothetical protein